MTTTIVLSIVLGFAFGFVLNRIGATNPENIINMLRLKDMHLFKSILFGVGLSIVLLFAGLEFGLIDAGHLSVKAASIGVLIGGAILGVGFAFGFCPGTSVAAAGTGRKDAWFFIVGGLVGAFAYMMTYGAVKATGLLDAVYGGKVTFAETSSKFASLIPDVPGLLVAFIIGAVLMIIAWKMPMKIGK